MDKEDKKYQLLDNRIVCKYGDKCYQKNPTHHEKYKHPQKRKTPRSPQQTPKKLKTDKVEPSKVDSDAEDYSIDDDSNTSSESIPKETNAKVNHDVSDSDPDDDSESNHSETEDNSNKMEETSNIQEENTVDSDKQENLEDIKTKNGTDSDDSKDTKDKTYSNKEKEWNSVIKDKFLVDMPPDFFQFWDFCEKQAPKCPSEALSKVGIFLVGPYDVLAGKFSKVDKPPEDYLIHWRYYRDPPELQTVLRSDDANGYHIGYFRDAPDKTPVLLVSNAPQKNGILTPMGGNIFAAVNLYLEDLKKSGNPFRKMAVGGIQAALTKEAQRLGIDLSRKTKAIVAREKKIVTRSFNKIGLCVPYNKKSQVGYRELAQTNKELEANLNKLDQAKTKAEQDKCFSDLQPVFTYTSIASDECDFGTGIELGWNIISHGTDRLNATAGRFLASNYRLFNMEAFAKIAEAHMKNRRKGNKLSII
ncbi:unnamed protein product [Diabrotica balteata]|uniref:PBZ-type domain-containing protein n=1 Tax=Diabrotica balteata TaxID=107213 RepID=A0A9N9X7J2_DIABA|nr:unnamed protein product [Diabrotica balteata]